MFKKKDAKAGPAAPAAAAAAPAAAADAVPPAADPAPSAAAPVENISLQGKYIFVRNEAFEDYLEASGVNWVVKKIALNASPALDIVTHEEGDKIKIHIKFNCLAAKNKDFSFHVGEDYEDSQMNNGHAMKVSPKWEGEKLVLTFTPKEEGKGKPFKQTFELQENELTMTLELGDVTARRFFKKTSTK